MSRMGLFICGIMLVFLDERLKVLMRVKSLLRYYSVYIPLAYKCVLFHWYIKYIYNNNIKQTFIPHFVALYYSTD